VLDLEVARNRIALTLRLDDEVGKAGGTKTQGATRENSRPSSASPARKPAPASGGGALAEAMRRASEKSGRGK